MGLFDRFKKEYKEKKEKQKRFEKFAEEGGTFSISSKTEDILYKERTDEERQREIIEKNAIMKEKYPDSLKQVRVCRALNCNIKENNMTGKECKFCRNFCCIDHLLRDKHNCNIDEVDLPKGTR